MLCFILKQAEKLFHPCVSERCVFERESGGGEHIRAFPFAVCLQGLKPTQQQSVLSLVSLCLLLPLSAATSHSLPYNFPWQTQTEATAPMAAASASDLLTHVQPGLGRGGGIFPHLAGKALGAVAALEDLQAVGAFLPLLGAHLSLPQHRLADFGPEVAGAAIAVRTVGRAQAGVALVTLERRTGNTETSQKAANSKTTESIHWPETVLDFVN